MIKGLARFTCLLLVCILLGVVPDAHAGNPPTVAAAGPSQKSQAGGSTASSERTSPAERYSESTVPALRIGRYSRPVEITGRWAQLVRSYGAILNGLTPKRTCGGRIDARFSGYELLVVVGRPESMLQDACARLVTAGRPCELLRVPAEALQALPQSPPAAELGAHPEGCVSASPAFVSRSAQAITAPIHPTVAQPDTPAVVLPASVPELPSADGTGATVTVMRVGRYFPGTDFGSAWNHLTRRYPDLLADMVPVTLPGAVVSSQLGSLMVLAVHGPAESALQQTCRQLIYRGLPCEVFPVQAADLRSLAQPLPGTRTATQPITRSRSDDQPGAARSRAVAAPSGPPPLSTGPERTSDPAQAPAAVGSPPGQAEIMISIADRRLFVVLADGVRMNFPIGIARNRSLIVFGETQVVGKITHPTWSPTPAMRRLNPSLPNSIGPGPNNPLGAYALALGWPYILIHGTNNPASVGGAVSSGCYRMLPRDIETLFNLVSVGARVRVVNGPVKLVQGPAEALLNRVVATVPAVGYGMKPDVEANTAASHD